MLTLLFAIALQPVDVAKVKSEFEAMMAGTDVVQEQSFDCMDAQTRAQLKAHVMDATPQIVVAGALSACKQIRTDLVTALMSNNSPISEASAHKLADNWFKKLEGIYSEHVEKMLLDPKLAEARTNIVMDRWRKCVSDKAVEWSRLTDDAATVGQAAVGACYDFTPNVQTAIGYQLRSKGLSAGRSGEMLDSLQGTMKDVAIRVIISERAKRLPKQSPR